MTSWTTERIDILRRLWRDGYSASQIAAELRDVSRNAVIGKLHRLGISGGGRLRLSKAGSLPAPRPRQRRPKPAPLPKVEPAPVQPSVEAIPTAEPPAVLGGVPLLDLRHRQCRWIIGGEVRGPETLFCGATTSSETSSWCSLHASMVFGIGTYSERQAAKIARGVE